MNPTKTSKRVFIPFGELLVGDHFIVHPQHLVNTSPKAVFVKLNSNLYMDTRTSFRTGIYGQNPYRTWVSLVG